MGLLSRLLGSRQSKAAAKKSEARKSEQTKYRSVGIVIPESGCCEAVKSIGGARFLSAEAPKLPLPDCDQAECRCTYEHFSDRRTDIRRNADLGFAMGKIFWEDESRQAGKPGRRSTDV